MAKSVKGSENQETLDLVLDDSSLSFSEPELSGKENDKTVVIDESEKEYEAMLEQQREMAALITRKRRSREKEELRLKLVAMKSELEYLDSPVIAPAPDKFNNGGARPKNRDFDERNGDFSRNNVSPVKFVQLERTVYPSSSRNTSTQYSTVKGKVPKSPYSSIIAHSNKFSKVSSTKKSLPDTKMLEARVETAEVNLEVPTAPVVSGSEKVPADNLRPELERNSQSMGLLSINIVSPSTLSERFAASYSLRNPNIPDDCVEIVPPGIDVNRILDLQERSYRINAAHQIPRAREAQVPSPREPPRVNPFQVPSDTEADYRRRNRVGTAAGGDSELSDQSDVAPSLGVVPKRGKNPLQSGILAKATDTVKYPQDWPHIALQSDKAGGCYSFQDLDTKMFVTGELELISRLYVSDIERDGRIQLLKSLMYLSQVYDWKTILRLYTEVVSGIEQGLLTWSSQFDVTIGRSLQRQGPRSGSRVTLTKNTVPQKKSGYKPRPTYCKEYQNASCPFTEEKHWGTVNGERMQVEHICASCLIRRKEVAGHSENSTDCPCRSTRGGTQ